MYSALSLRACFPGRFSYITKIYYKNKKCILFHLNVISASLRMQAAEMYWSSTLFERFFSSQTLIFEY